MNKKQQMLQDRKLLQQLYSRLNITLQEKVNTNTNPILHRPQNNLMSKSIAHKFYNSKRYKLNQNKQPSNKQSNHIFTNTGITKSQNHKRRLSQPQIIHKIENKQFDRKFQRYQNTQLNNILTKRKSIKVQTQNICGSQNLVNQQNQTSKLKGRSFRAVSAHFTSRRAKTNQGQCFSFRKTCQNWFSNSTRLKEKGEIKGWDIEVDNLDVNLIQLKLSTKPY